LAGLVKAKEDAEKEAAAELERQEAARKRKEQDEQRFIALYGTGMVYDRFNDSFHYGSMCYNSSEFYEMEDAKFEKAVSQIALNISELKAAEEKERVRLAELARKQQEELDAERKKSEEEREKQEAEIRKQQEIAYALKAELEAKQREEAKAEAERIAKEKAELAAAELAAKAPRKERLMAWVDGFSIPAFNDDAVASDIIAKFEAFKNWAKGQVEKI
jgi:hypothetical protein